MPADERLTQLAERLDCLTEDDLCLLTDNSASTVKSWRHRGKGPAYVMAGSRCLYPRAEVAAWLQSHVKAQRPPDAKGFL